MITRWIDKINARPDVEERRRLEDYLQLAGGIALIGGYETVSRIQLGQSREALIPGTRLLRHC